MEKHAKYLTTADLAARWHVCTITARNFMRRKGSGAIKISRKFLVTEKEVIAYEATQKVRP
jgi:hypothetical protein